MGESIQASVPEKSPGILPGAYCALYAFFPGLSSTRPERPAGLDGFLFFGYNTTVNMTEYEQHRGDCAEEDTGTDVHPDFRKAPAKAEKQRHAPVASSREDSRASEYKRL